MKNKQQSLAEDIKNKHYYSRALEWYMHKYLRVYFDRIYWLILFLVFFTASFYLYLNITYWLPTKTVMPIVLYNDDVINKQPIAVTLNDKYSQQPDKALLEYLLVHYTKNREEFHKGDFDVLTLDNRVKKVANNSTSDVSKEYKKTFDTNNPNHPITILGKNGERTVKLVSFIFHEKPKTKKEENLFATILESDLPEKATLTIEVSDKKLTTDLTKQLWQVDIAFAFSGIIVNKITNNVTLSKFMVTDYRITKSK
jgi:type IV secretory pathway component VirB8